MAFQIVKKNLKPEYNRVSYDEAPEPKQHTLQPIVTGSSVIALKFKGGVLIAADTMLSYGSMSKFKNVQRIEKLNDATVLASSGEFSDFQEVIRLINEQTKQEFLNDDNIKFTPRDYGNYLSQLQYAKRNKFNPLYLGNVVGGFQEGQPYLAHVDMYGTYLEKKYVTTGMATYFCGPIIENNWNEDLSEEVARKVAVECFKVLFYRDTRATDVIQISTVTQQGVKIDQPFKVETEWNYKAFRERANEKLHQW